MKFRTKTTEVDAIQFTGDNIDEVITWSDKLNEPDNYHFLSLSEINGNTRICIKDALGCVTETNIDNTINNYFFSINIGVNLVFMLNKAAFESKYEPVV